MFRPPPAFNFGLPNETALRVKHRGGPTRALRASHASHHQLADIINPPFPVASIGPPVTMKTRVSKTWTGSPLPKPSVTQKELLDVVAGTGMRDGHVILPESGKTC